MSILDINNLIVTSDNVNCWYEELNQESVLSVALYLMSHTGRSAALL